MDRNEVKNALSKAADSRKRILERYPFFGRLLMRMGLSFEDCGTAYTDMSKVVFDPSFIKDFDSRCMDFLFLHELMHCVLKHCVRGSGKVALIYNIACDIVVNSMVMEAMGIEGEFVLHGHEVMHYAPDGKEGREYTAEEVYDMLKKESREMSKAGSDGDTVDSHGQWEGCCETDILNAEWDEYIKEAARAAGNTSGIPEKIARLLDRIKTKPVIHWKQVLQDFIRHDRADYTFCPPDRRFSGNIILPSFVDDIDGSCVKKLWFAVDTSGSISNEELAIALNEIRTAVSQIENMSGYISFFDAKISAPVEFESCEDIDKITPIGGGGTSFKCIFDGMKEFFKEELPCGIIIMTDGYADFPDESAALDVPVIWIITKSKVTPPWGQYVTIE